MAEVSLQLYNGASKIVNLSEQEMTLAKKWHSFTAMDKERQNLWGFLQEHGENVQENDHRLTCYVLYLTLK